MDRPTTPDSPIAAQMIQSPNCDARKNGAKAHILLLHYTAMPDADAALQRLCDPAAKVSAHYLVYENGTVVQLVPETLRAWHAGQSYWAGSKDINSHSIGVEISNIGHAGGLPPYPDVQIAAVIRLCRDIMHRHAIAAADVLGHSDVAPGRKRDPGEHFPWNRLGAADVGLWVRPAPVVAGAILGPGDSGPGVRQVQALLGAYGYRIDENGVYDDKTTDVVRAFQQHFRQELVDGVADVSTIATLRDLLAARPMTQLA